MAVTAAPAFDVVSCHAPFTKAIVCVITYPELAMGMLAAPVRASLKIDTWLKKPVAAATAPVSQDDGMVWRSTVAMVAFRYPLTLLWIPLKIPVDDAVVYETPGRVLRH